MLASRDVDQCVDLTYVPKMSKFNVDYQGSGDKCPMSLSCICATSLEVDISMQS